MYKILTEVKFVHGQKIKLYTQLQEKVCEPFGITWMSA